MKNYVKKPVVVQAVEYNGANKEEIEAFVGKKLDTVYTELKEPLELKIPTLEGDMKVSKGDYVIKGIKGEFYPCKPDIFNNSYDEVGTSIITEGQKRVRMSFNPSALKRVEKFKYIMAQAIDILSEEAETVKVSLYDMEEKEYNSLNSDFQRELATTKTQIQQASMWGVSALTSNITFKKDDILKNKEIIGTAINIPPHQQRVLDERKDLVEKQKALSSFILTNPIYSTLSEEEQKSLNNQNIVMIEYIAILNERINRF